MSKVFASGSDFISFALASGSSPPPVTFSFTDGNGKVSTNLGATSFSNDVPGFAEAPLGNVDASPVLGLETAPNAFPYTLQLTGTASGPLDLAVTMPRGDGTFTSGQISGVAISPGLKGRVVLNATNGLTLELDTNNDGTFVTQLPLTSINVSAEGPTLLSANVIGPETLPGATPLGVQMALLFDRIVDATSAQQTGNYQIPQNAVQTARAQLSGRIVVANLQQPEGTYVPTTVHINGIADQRGALGPILALPIGSQIADPGAVVSGRVFNADGTPVTTGTVTYAQIPPQANCSDEANEQPAGVSAIPLNGDGHYEVRYVRQDQCGSPFSISTTDPNTGGLRQVSSFVRFAGEQILVDIALFGRGGVNGTVRDLTGTPVPGATVVVLSGTDTQIGAKAVTDGSGQYSVTGITVGPVSVQAGKGNSLGHSAGNIPRAGSIATIDVTLDSGAVSVSGTLAKLEPGTSVPVAVPNWPVVYNLDDHPGLAPTPLAVVNTDSDGKFSFTGVPEGNFVITTQLTVKDFGSVRNFAKANDQLTGQNITVAITAQGTVSGKVTLPDGNPASGVVVTASGSGVLTAADGTYSLPVQIQQSTQTIQAITRDTLRQGKATVLLTQQGQTLSNVNIVLSGLGNVQFTVFDANGNRLANQPVALACSAPCGCNPVTVQTQPDGSTKIVATPMVTGADGTVQFAGLPVGTVGVKAVSPSFDVAEASATIPADNATGFGILRFAGSGTVTGAVVNPDNTPSFGANVALTANVYDPVSCSLGQGLAQQVQTDQSGTFKFTGVHAGQLGVTASQVFLPTQVGAQGSLTNGQTVNFNLKLINTISGVFSGTVFLPDGVTPAGAGIQVTAKGALPDVTVNTDANGHFKFAKIFPQASYTVTVRDPVTGGVVQDNVFLPANQDVAHDFRLKGRGTVTVQVVDGSNKPVNIASIQLTENTFPNNLQEATIQPSDLGTVTFQQVFEGPFSVVASDTFGRGGRASSVLPGPGATVNVVVQLTSTGTVQGHFYMPDGTTAIPFGSVSLTANGRQIGQVTTDGNADPGSFSFTFVPAGPVLLQAQDPVTARVGVAAGTIATDGQTLVLNVIAEGLGTVQGFVTSDGVNQAGANVDIFSGNYHAATTTDSTGHYLVSGAPVGHIVVNAAFSNGFLLGTNSANLSGDGTQVEIDVALRGSGAIQGMVFQADGVTPAPGALVTVTVGGQGGGTESVSTDASGNFTFSIVPEGIATLTARALNTIDEGQKVVDVTAGSTLQPTIQLNGVGSITGVTEDSNGNPIAGRLTVTGTGAFPYTFGVDTGADGSFSLPQVLAGSFTASLRVTNGTIVSSGTIFSSVTPNANTAISVKLQQSGSVSGKVFRSDRTTPAAGANVTISVSAGSVVVQAQTDGSFSAVGIPLGNFTVRIVDPITTGQALIQNQSITTAAPDANFPNIVLDDTPMSVVSIAPADGATGVNASQAVVVSFSNALQSTAGIQFSSVARGPFSLTGSLSPDGKAATFSGVPASDQVTVNVTTDVTDTLGRHPLQPATATFKTGPPHVESITPARGAIQVAGNLPVTVNFSEPLAASTNLASLIIVSGPAGPVPGSTVLVPPAQAVFTPTASLPTNSLFTVTVNGATDLGNNVQTVPFISTFATVDTVAPVLQLIAPAPGAFTANSQPSITVSVSDNLSGVNALSETLAIDGQAVSSQRFASQIQYTVLSPLSQGQHTVTASAADNAGNVGNLTASFIVDSVPPTAAQITSLTSGQVVIGTIQLTATASDAGSGVARIDVLVDGGVLLNLPAPSFQTSFNTISLTDGPHTFSARAVDAAGNIGPVGTGIPVIVNNQRLTISFSTPAPNTFFRNSVTVAALPSEPVQQVQFTLGTQSITVTTSPYQATFSLTSVPDGQQIITANATGFASETASATIAINVKQTPPVAPNPALINAEPPSNGSSLVHGSATSVEAGDQVQITDINSNRLVTTTAAADGSFSTNIAAIAGDVLSIVSVDVVGNRSPATSITVRHIASLPPVSSVQPVDGSTAIPTNSVVVVRFASVVQAASVVSGTVTLSQGSTPVPGSLSLSNDQLSVTFAPSLALAGLTTYTVKVQDAASGSNAVLFQSSFTTAVARDTTPPTVLRVSPDSGFSGVPLNAPFVVQFSKTMNPGTFNSTNFSVRDSSANTVNQFPAGTIQVDSTNTTATFVPQLPWGAGHTFVVSLTSGLTDTAGNALSGRSFNFTTAFTSDNTPPHLLQVSPPDQTTGVPTNAVIDLSFSKTVDTAKAANGVQISTAGQPVTGVVAFSIGDQRLTFTPTVALSPNTTYTVTVTASVTDVAGNALDNPNTFTFQTGPTTDTVRPSVVLFDPVNGVSGVETNALIRVGFSERIDPVTVTNGTIQVWPNSTGVPIAGTATASADGLSATFASGGLLPSTSYHVQVNTNGITDLAGNGINGNSINFSTGQVADGDTPAGVVAVSPQNGSTGVPLNARISIQFSEPMSSVSMESNPVVVTQAGGAVVAGTLSISADHTTMMLAPASPLAANSSYTVSVIGVADVSGNVAPAFTSSFATGTVTLGTRMNVLSISPSNGTANVPTTTPVVVTFSAPVDVNTVNNGSVQISINAGNSPLIAGVYSVNGPVVTFTPNQAWEVNSSFAVRVNTNQVLDVAGNQVNGASSTFTTAAGVDTAAPTVVAVAPQNGAAGIGLNSAVVLTFSKPLSNTTVNGNTFELLANGVQLTPGVSLSADNTTVVMSGITLPANSLVTVVATRDVTDLAGNHLVDFRSTFTTGPAFDSGHPSVVSQRPGSGATGVGVTSTIVLYVNEPMNVATVAGALHVVQNGVVVSGTVQVRDGGQTIEFTPALPWQFNAVVEVNLDATALDVDGQTLNNYQGTFHTMLNLTTTAPALVATNPANGSSGAPTNTVIEAAFNVPLNAATVNGSTVVLNSSPSLSTSTIVPSTVSLLSGGTIIQIVPTAPLSASHTYFVTLSSGLIGSNGLAQPIGNLDFVFTTGANAEAGAPAIVWVAPPDGVTNVPVNANVRVLFSEPVNPLTVNGSSIQLSGGGSAAVADSVNFSNNNQSAVLVLHEPLPESTQMTLTVAGVQDLAGNAVVAQTTHFTTGTGPDVTAPSVVSEAPFSGQGGVPLNAVVNVELSEPIDFGTVNGQTFAVRDNTAGGVFIGGTYATSADNRTLTFVPAAALAAGHNYTVLVSETGQQMADYAGNTLNGIQWAFTTSSASDLTAPQILQLSPRDGLTQAPINSRITMFFNKPVAGQSVLNVAQAVLTAAGIPQPVFAGIFNNNQEVVLTPVNQLSPNTTYTITLAGIQEVAGNAMSGPVVTSFTTGSEADLIRPSVVLFDPVNNAGGVETNALIRVGFSERIDPVTVTNGTIQVWTNSTGVPIAGTATASADGLSATFASGGLLPSTSYHVQVNTNGITDLAGNGINGNSINFTTGTGSDTDTPVGIIAVSPTNGQTGLPLNARVSVMFSEPMSSVSMESNPIVLTQAGGAVVGTLSISADHTTMTLAPASPLAASSSYTVNVSGVTDVSGNLAPAFTSSFATGTATLGTRLSVSSVSPLSGATAPTTTSVTLSFSAPVDVSTVNSASVQVRINNSVLVNGSYSLNGSVITFTPIAPLPASTSITVTVNTNQVLDVAGNPVNFFQSSFTTGTQ